MSNAFDAIRDALNEHETMKKAVRNNAARMALLLVGNLRDSGITPWVLADLKRELADYNIHTKSWKRHG